MRGFFRRLALRPLRSVVTIVQVMLSAFAITAVLSAINSLNPEPESPERFDLVAATVGDRTVRQYALFDADLHAELERLVPAVSGVSLTYDLALPTVEVGENIYQFRAGAAVEPAFFELGDVSIVEGTAFTAQEAELGEAVMVISEAAAATLFPGGGAVGSTLRLRSEGVPYRVVGVFRRERDAQGAALYVPVGNRSLAVTTLNVLAAPGQAGEAQAQLIQAVRSVYAARLDELGRAPGNDLRVAFPGQPDAERDPDRLSLVAFTAFALITLVVGIIGAFSLLTVNALERQRDVAIRRALGETRQRVVAGFVGEAGTLGLLAGLAGVALAALILPSLQPTIGTASSSNLSLAFDGTSAVTALAVVTLLNAVLSLVPAWQTVRSSPVAVLSEA